jgi:uncharacterized membrane protein
MKKMQNLTNAVLAFGLWSAAALALRLNPAPALADDSAPIVINFTKCLDFDTGLWTGTVDGDCGPGTIVHVTTALDDSKDVWRLEGTYAISTSTCTFTAVCSGKVNFHTGLIVLNGEVTADSADYAGARVHLQGQALFGEASICSEGRITLNPKAIR